MKIAKSGNTTLKFNESQALKNPNEIQALLDEIYDDAINAITKAKIKEMNTSA